MRSYTAIAIEKLAHLVQHAKSEQACIAAASELLSRGGANRRSRSRAMTRCRRVSGTPVASLTAEERAALVASIAESLKAAT
jgi:hypothetical protein